MQLSSIPGLCFLTWLLICSSFTSMCCKSVQLNAVKSYTSCWVLGMNGCLASLTFQWSRVLLLLLLFLHLLVLFHLLLLFLFSASAVLPSASAVHHVAAAHHILGCFCSTGCFSFLLFLHLLLHTVHDVAAAATHSFFDDQGPAYHLHPNWLHED